MQMKRVILALGLMVCPRLLPAAEITLIDDRAHDCIAELSGSIAEGDSARLLAVMAQAAETSRFAEDIYMGAPFDDGALNFTSYAPINLCLNSPGGNLAEAVALTEVVHGHLGTVIRAGDTCESACALVFMAGAHNTQTDAGIVVTRYLHVDGKLGFHAPSLSVPEGRYDASTVARAYQISVAATEMIFRNLVKFRFPASLAARMHQIPPDEMFYVSTVREAARWGISVIGVAPPDVTSDAVLRTACTNIYRRAQDAYTSDPDAWFTGMPPPTPLRRQSDGRFRYEGFGMEATGFCAGYVADRARQPDYASQTRAAALADEVWGHASLIEAEPLLGYTLLENFMGYPHRLRLTALPRDGRGPLADRPGTCHVFDSLQAPVDMSPCTESRTLGPDGRLVAVHVWPSGARTTVETIGAQLRINGVEAYETQVRALGQDTPCVFNTGSSNTFCFVAQ